MNEKTAPFLLKVDAALMEPLSSEVIISGELLLQNGAAMYYPIPGSREAHIRLDRLGKHKYPWYNADQLQNMHYHLNTGKTVTWYMPDLWEDNKLLNGYIPYPMKLTAASR